MMRESFGWIVRGIAEWEEKEKLFEPVIKALAKVACVPEQVSKKVKVINESFGLQPKTDCS